MEPFLLVLLGMVLAVQPAHSVVCYTCDSQSTNDNCIKLTVNCSVSGYVCMTVVDVSQIGSMNPQMIISKSCTPQCTPISYSVVIATYTVSCCRGNLCNLSGAESVNVSYVAIAITCFFTFLLHAAGL